MKDFNHLIKPFNVLLDSISYRKQVAYLTEEGNWRGPDRETISKKIGRYYGNHEGTVHFSEEISPEATIKAVISSLNLEAQVDKW